MLQSTFYMNSVNLGPGTKKNGLKFVILMCPDHLRNWLEFGHILSMFLIWVQFWLMKWDTCCINNYSVVLL